MLPHSHYRVEAVALFGAAALNTRRVILPHKFIQRIKLLHGVLMELLFRTQPVGIRKEIILLMISSNCSGFPISMLVLRVQSK